MAADLGTERGKERRLRERLADTIVEQRRAVAEADRLGAMSRLAGTAARQRARAAALADEIEELRAELRAQSLVVAELEADEDGAPPPRAEE